MARVQPSEEISHRFDFALLCNARGHKDAVEIGTDHGIFARDFLSRFAGHWLICCDPYEPYDERPYDRTPDRIMAVHALLPYHGRFRFVGARSPDCVPWVCTFVSPSFVYIDGAHDYKSVKSDIAAWWAVLPPGGLLAGHDYDDAHHPGVIRAVNEFAEREDVTIRLTHEAEAPSWYAYKCPRGEPEQLFIRHYREATMENPACPPSVV